MAVHRAANRDREAVVTMLKHFHNAGKYDWSFDAPLVNRTVEYMISDTDCILLVATDSSGKPVGCLGATNEESLLAPLKTSIERFLWVNVGERGRVHKELLTSWLTWARAECCSGALLTSQAHMREKAIGRLYRRFGFNLVELTYMKVL